MEFNIKKVGLNELDETAELFNLYRIFYRQNEDYQQCREFVRERMIHDQSTIFVVYANDKAVGFVQLYKLYHYIKLAKQYLLSDLFVHPDYRGHGLSVVLINQAKQWCVDTEACGLMLETEKTNDIGNKLYPRCGFEYDGNHNYYYWWK
ncbi:MULTISPECIES: GNAT family N-acetyltransferase [Sphingobacterium]|uniref:GNAT superfamily N-acetyltransferase n=1 Tax=Sphingobacterium zeae TaxID=1776859 RepID=A0ABU0U3T1_9SPHI|nr:MULTISPECIES: GNAT family N-acetyltransferase [Sphingobacterium]MDQ1149590.1 GNAT superfamily N-acetyltransferase [Sphingobacterium zeae]MDR6735277.1 GNAT superfamily N-acetyltransferase [Sphingobacterium sp. 2149]